MVDKLRSESGGESHSHFFLFNLSVKQVLEYDIVELLGRHAIGPACVEELVSVIEQSVVTEGVRHDRIPSMPCAEDREASLSTEDLTEVSVNESTEQPGADSYRVATKDDWTLSQDKSI